MGDYDISWNAVLAAAVGAIAVGQPLVIDSDGFYWPSTSANRTTFGAPTSGIARTAADGVSVKVVDVQHGGIIPANQLTLGPGAAQFVRVNASGGLERVASPGPTDDIIGKADLAGNLNMDNRAIGNGAGGASLTGTTNGVLSLSGANAGTADDSFSMPATGKMAVGWDVSGLSDKGAFYVYCATSGTETYASAVANGTLPDGGLIRISYYNADGPFHGDSASIVTYQASTDNTPNGPGSFSSVAMGISGGVPFFGDPDRTTQSNIYGDGIFIDAGPGGGGAGTYPLTDHTGEIWLQNKALDAPASGFAKGYIRLLDYGPAGILTVGASGYLYSALGSANQVLAVNGAGTGLVWTTPGGGFTAGGDLSGSSSSQTVIKISGSSPIAIAPAVLQWVIGASSPTLKQIDQTANSTNGQALTVQAQNATGTTSTGGALNLTSGTGSTAAGNINLVSGSITALSCLPTGAWQFGVSIGAPTLNQATIGTASATGAPLTVQAQNCSGTTSTGGALNLTSGTGTASAGSVKIQTGGTDRFTVTPLVATSLNPIAIGGTTPGSGDLRVLNGFSMHGQGPSAENVQIIKWSGSGAYDLNFGEATNVGVINWTTSTGGNQNIICGITYVAQFTSTNIQFQMPVVGFVNPWPAINGTGTQAMADANQTPGSSVFVNRTIKTTGALTATRTLTLPTATDAQGYEKIINNTCTGAFSVTVSVGAGTTVSVANGKSAIVWIDSRGVTRITPDT